MEFTFKAFSAVTTDDIIRSYEITGFSEDQSKQSSKLRKIVQNPPALSDLPDEWKIKYDPTGLGIVRKGKNRANPKNLHLVWTCSVCNKNYSTKYNAKGHWSAPGGCPSISTLKSFKPTSKGNAYFFSENLD